MRTKDRRYAKTGARPITLMFSDFVDNGYLERNTRVAFVRFREARRPGFQVVTIEDSEQTSKVSLIMPENTVLVVREVAEP